LTSCDVPPTIAVSSGWRAVYGMQLLVSVSSAGEARSAVAGGADIVDAKDPSTGALGPVSLDAFISIRAAVDPSRLVTAALGDAGDGARLEALARGYVARGAGLVKAGFAGIADPARVAEIIARVQTACAEADETAGVVAVAYADTVGGASIDAAELVAIAASVGARGVLIDTADKRGPGLMGLWSVDVLASWVAQAHARGLVAAVAGKLAAQDLAAVCDAGADIAGVRGAACEGGRNGVISAERVGALRCAGSFEPRTAAQPNG
jgi:(5-formylfuran-3-yl)methyl phosphate synthase